MSAATIDELKREFSRDRLEQLAAMEGLPVRGHRMRCPSGCSDDPRRATTGERDGVGVWHCHGCGTSGSAIDLLKQTRHVDDARAIAELTALVRHLPPAPRQKEPTKKDGRKLWEALSKTDPAGEDYLRSRGLGAAIDRELVRFNVGASGDSWLDQKARAGYRVALALRKAAGEIVSFQLRAVRGLSPSKLSLAGVPTAGLAFGDTAAARTATRVFVTEGIADTIALQIIGECTVGTDGEGKLRATPLFLNDVRGREFVLCPQNDAHEKSQTAFAALAAEIASAGGVVRILTTPEAYKDPAEWLRAVGLPEFKAALASLPQPFQRSAVGTETMAPAPSAGDDDSPAKFVPTESGLAERLVGRHVRDLRYCGEWKRWLVWDRIRWRLDHSGAVQRHVKHLLRDMCGEAARAGDKGLVEFLFKSERRAVRENVEALARSEAPVQVSHAELDARGMLLNCSNGTIDLATGALLPHRREELHTKVAPVVFDPNAMCPRWLAFLDRIFAGNQELIAYIQKAVGYSLSADVGEQVFFILWGSGANGKSTFLVTLLDLLGDYARPGVADLLLAKSHERHPTELADLFGARFVVFQETAEGLRFDESKVKALTGGDRIKARRMREDFWEFSPTHKLWLGTNHRPAIRGTDHAIWRRVRLIPFTVTIPPAERDPRLPEKLRAELPGIFAWAIRGCVAWQRDGLVAPAMVSAAVDQYRQSEDRLAGFFADCCVVEQGKQAAAKELYAAFKAWATESGEHVPSAKAFGQRLADRGFVSDEAGHDKHRVWCGVGLLSTRRGDSGLPTSSEADGPSQD